MPSSLHLKRPRAIAVKVREVFEEFDIETTALAEVRDSVGTIAAWTQGPGRMA